VYCQELEKLNEAISEKRPEFVNRKGVTFHQHNARTHTSVVTHQKLRQLGWELLMQNSLNGKTFDNEEAIKSQLNQFFCRSSISVE